jgi:ribosomal protein S18 acetylase RimI-like enzyme
VRDQAAAASAVRVRPATAADAEQIARVHVESWRTAYRGLVPQAILDGLSIERRSEFWSRRLLEPGEARTWLGEQGGEVVGFVATGRPSDPELQPDAAEVESIYLLAESRGLGLGRLLLATATRDLVERGFASAILWVFTANDRARRFYEAAGWQPDGTSQMLDFDGTAIEEIRYGIELVSGL